MKKFTLLLLSLILTLSCFSQPKNQVITKNGKVYSGTIDSYLGKTVNFTKQFKDLGDNSIPVEDIKQIIGKLPKYRIKSILKDNPNIIFNVSEVNSQNIIGDSKIQLQQNVNNQFTPGNYLVAAGNRYMAGIGVSVVGAGIMAAGGSEGSNSLLIVGGATSFIGIIISFTGHVQLVKAGKALNKEAITVSAAKKGVGLSINF